MEIVLSSTKYKALLTDVRSADRTNQSGQETTLTYNGVSYYFRAKNFALVAYSTGGGRVNLTSYNHVEPMDTVNKTSLQISLATAGAGQTQMNRHLSTVVAFISEAARSKVVEKAFIQVLASGASMNLNDYAVLFKAYNQPARYCGYLDVNSGYSPHWKPLEKTDYLRFFQSDGFTGDKTAQCAKVQAL